jgi:hypothetical protein
MERARKVVKISGFHISGNMYLTCALMQVQIQMQSRAWLQLYLKRGPTYVIIKKRSL